MSSKLGTILSMIFVVMFLLFGLDIISIQYAYSELDSKGVIVSYNISKKCRIDNEFLLFLGKKYSVSISAPPNQSTNYGDVVEFILSSDFKPIVISNDPVPIKIKRTAVIGYYG